MRQSLGWLWLFILGGAAIAAVLAWLICQLLTPEYRAEAYLLIEEKSQVLTDETAENDQSEDGNQITSLHFDELLSKVWLQLNLAEDADFMPLIVKSPQLTMQEQAVATLREGLHVLNIARSPVLVVQYTSPIAQQAAKIVNAVADEFVAMHNSERGETSEGATEHVAQEIKRLRAQLDHAQQELSDYLLAGPDSFSAERLLTDKQYAEAEANAEHLRQALTESLSLDVLPDIAAFDPLRSLISQRDQLNAQIAELSVSLLEDHPRIKSLHFELAELDRKITTEGQKRLGSLEDEVATLKANPKSLAGLESTDQIKSGEDAKLQSLEEGVAVQRKNLQNYLERYKMALADTSPISARILTRADVPAAPYFPNTWLVVSIVFVVSAFLLLVFSLLWRMYSLPLTKQPMPRLPNTDGQADDPTDKITDYGSGLNEPMDDNFTAFFNEVAPDNPNSVDAIVEQIIQQRKKRVIVVSPEGDIASAGSVRLIRNLADREKRVLLIDMTAYGTLGLAMLDGIEKSGITELLSGRRRLDDVIHIDRFSSAHVMPLGNVEPEIAMLSADRLPLILDALETVYDFVIVECGPSTTQQLHQIISGPATVVMSIVNPDDNAVAQAALHMDQDGFEDVIILLSDAGKQVYRN